MMENIERELAKENEKNLCANEKCTSGEDGKRKKLAQHGDHPGRAQPVLFALLRRAIQPGITPTTPTEYNIIGDVIVSTMVFWPGLFYIVFFARKREPAPHLSKDAAPARPARGRSSKREGC